VARVVERALWLPYLTMALLSAASVPIARQLSTPLTYPMLQATGGALLDSILAYLTATNLAAVVLVLAVASALPVLLGRAPIPRRVVSRSIAVALALCVVLGFLGRAHMDALGLYRNPLITLVASTWAEHRGASPPAHAGEVAGEGLAVDLRELSGRAKGHNVIWVILESAGARYFRLYGAKQDATPNLTAFAEQAIVFESAYAVCPMSIKALFSSICSRPPAAHTPIERYTQERTPCTSVAQVFRDAGYRTALVHSGWFAYLGMAGVVHDRGFDSLLDAGDVGGKHTTSFGVDEAASVARALEIIDSVPKGQPFFLLYMPIAGHHPYHSPGEGPRPFDTGVRGAAHGLPEYLSDLHRGDQALGTLIAEIDKRGLRDRTLWAFVGDHGEAFQQHGNFAHGQFIWEEDMHVPLVFIAPGLMRAQRRAPQVASAIDVVPTLLDLAGLPIPAGYRGRSLLAADPGVARLYADQSHDLLGLRTGRWKLIVDLGTNKSALFDLRDDPLETRDLSAREPQRVRRYAEDLRAWAERERGLILGSRD
jgi:phosphoglycerol transferase MdoB-like AlkP superfamily enzyme